MEWRLGCTGWSYDDWRGPFYPPGTPASEYLARYAQVFDCAEVDSTFYGPPKAATTQKWADSTPSGFVFAPKLPGVITHEKKLRDIDADLGEFLEGIAPLRQAGKLGPVLVQMSPSVTRAAEQDLWGLLDRIPPSMRVAVEFREASWLQERIYLELARRRACLAWSVNEHVQAPLARTTDFLYLRLVGDRALTQFGSIHRDHSAQIENLVGQAQVHAREADIAYIFPNNHFMGFAPATVSIVAKILGKPEPALERAKRMPRQRGLADF